MRLLILIISTLLFISGCNADRSLEAPDQSSPEGLQIIKLSEDQLTQIANAAIRTKIETAYIPELALEGDEFNQVITEETFLELRFNQITIIESPQEVLAGGVEIDEKSITLNNGVQAKWISFSTHKDNKEGASARLYFKLDNTFISIGKGDSNFDPTIESIAESLVPISEK